MVAFCLDGFNVLANAAATVDAVVVALLLLWWGWWWWAMTVTMIMMITPVAIASAGTGELKCWLKL